MDFTGFDLFALIRDFAADLDLVNFHEISQLSDSHIYTHIFCSCLTLIVVLIFSALQKPRGLSAKLHEIFNLLDKDGDHLLNKEELMPFVAILPTIINKEHMPWLTSVTTESEAVDNLLLAADPAVLVDHPVPIATKGITREHFVAMWGPKTASGAGPLDFLGLEHALTEDGFGLDEMIKEIKARY